MRREERRQLETDALLLRVEQATDWVRDNRRAVLTGLLALVGAALLVGGLLVQRGARRDAARVRLAALVTDIQSAAEGELGQREPCRSSLTGLVALADERGSSREGRTARYYAGVCHRALGDLAAAAAAFDGVRGRGDLLDALATMDFAGVKRRAGQGDEAAAAYRSLVEREGGELPLDPVLFELGVLEEEQGRPEAAAASYRRLAEEFPFSAFRPLADARLERLPSAEAEEPSAEAGEPSAGADAAGPDPGSGAGAAPDRPSGGEPGGSG